MVLDIVYSKLLVFYSVEYSVNSDFAKLCDNYSDYFLIIQGNFTIA